jgi:putative colanic acid biosysnthesis UDP-glucose lipid carrier transferase
MNTRYNSFFQFLFTFVDLWGINMVYIVALFSVNNISNVFDSAYIALFLVSNFAWLLSCSMTSIYINSDSYRTAAITRRTIQSFIFYTLVISAFVYFYTFTYSPKFIAIILSGFAGSLVLSRTLYVAAIKLIRIHEKFVRKVVIIGYNDAAKNLVDHHLSTSKNISVEGFFEHFENVHELSAFPIIGSPEECLQYAIDNKISEIYSTLPAKEYPFLYDMAEQAENNFIRFKFATDFHTYVHPKAHMDFADYVPILSLRREPLDDIANRIKKRTFDVFFSLFVIIFILSWLVPIIAILIKLDSKGPIFFIQNRLGRDLNRIPVFKFRTMKTTETDSQYKQATKDDPRVTRIGRILRKTSLDELPQFFNVLIGDMSISGPRPHPIKMNDDYKKIIDKYMIRHFLKPGITGWAQVSGYRGETKELKDIQGRIEHDIWYMENWSFLLDLKIIFLTVYNVIKGEKNAY